MKDKPKIALLKQEVYQDLYVCPVTEKDPEAILLSSMGRVGPIGLMAELDADFYIIKEEREWETQIYRKVITHRQRPSFAQNTNLGQTAGTRIQTPRKPVAQREICRRRTGNRLERV